MTPDPQVAEAARVNDDAVEQNTVEFDEVGLADASISGSNEAFSTLYAHYFPKVRGFCLRKLGSPEYAEDIAQEAFARAFERITDFGGPRHFGGWVGTIAANLCTDFLRRKKNTPVPLEDVERGPAYEVDPIRNITREDTGKLVRLALAKLEPRQREALLLHEVSGMSCAAVGQRLGISEVAAESLLARARRRLRKEITAKAAPVGLFGWGGLGVLPSFIRSWRRAREAFGRRTAELQAAALRSWESVGSNLVPSMDGAKVLVVAVSAALAVEVASAAAPPQIKAVPPSAPAQAAVPAPMSPDGDGGANTAAVPQLPVPDAKFYGRLNTDPGSEGVETGGDMTGPEAPGAARGFFGLNWDLDAHRTGERSASVFVRVFVQDQEGKQVAGATEQRDLGL